MSACELVNVVAVKSAVNVARKELEVKKLDGFRLNQTVRLQSGRVGSIYRFSTGYYGNCADVKVRLGNQTCLISQPLVWITKEKEKHVTKDNSKKPESP